MHNAHACSGRVSMEEQSELVCGDAVSMLPSFTVRKLWLPLLNVMATRS